MKSKCQYQWRPIVNTKEEQMQMFQGPGFELAFVGDGLGAPGQFFLDALDKIVHYYILL